MQFTPLRVPAINYGNLARLRALPLAGFAPLRSGMARWIDARTLRERWLLGMLAGIAALALYTTLVWRPMAAVRVAALAEIESNDRIVARLRVAGPDVARIAAARMGTPSTLITESAAKAGLTIQRIEPHGTTIAVSLDAASFDVLVRWLAAIERDAGLRVTDIKLERRPDPGIVSAQLTLTAA